MKDQFALHKKCIHNEIPVMILSGTDAVAHEVVEMYYNKAREMGCTPEFLADLRDKIDIDFKLFKKQEPNKIKLPD
ncbi:hypothetical protein FACS189451_04140 [Bacteroidia bacterium]|nr:hypothetical protein FACS189451_04140 [Bacteroidia bacterium]